MAEFDTWLTVRDGTRLAARVWLPDGLGPWPALLEYIPYRKNDGTALRDSLRHPWFAAHGYACVRVDLRGSGDSAGLLLDEYLPQEQLDGVDVIAWIAAQPWCDGNVGLFGKSWGGFNALQIAAHNPPALKAIITLYSTDDRYADDVHYLGGAVLGSEMLSWATTMLAYNGRPPDPATWGEAWRGEWLKRLAHTPAYIIPWLSHQRRDAYWAQGSVAEDFRQIKIPVLAVGGWADAYTNAVFRIVKGLSGAVPARGIVGPWVHDYPEVAVPQPAIGFLQESLRWWDQWLKGRETGIMAEPDLRVWIQDACDPATALETRPGFWAGQPITVEPDLIELPVPGPNDIPLAYGHGADAGVWCPYGSPGDLAGDQALEDALCLCADSAPAGPQGEVILGFPELRATIESDRPVAQLAVRLCAVSPAGVSQLVCGGVLNLSHRESQADPTPVPAQVPIPVKVWLDSAGYRLLPGWRWRVALAGSWWPRAWPAPVAGRLRLVTGALYLPRRDARPEDGTVGFPPAETAPLRPHTAVRPKARQRSIERGSDLVRLRDWQDDGLTRLEPDGLTFGSVSEDRYAIRPPDPCSAEAHCRRTLTLARGAWRVRIEAEASLQADAHAFLVHHRLEAYEGDTLVFDHAEQRRIPRDLG